MQIISIKYNLSDSFCFREVFHDGIRIVEASFRKTIWHILLFQVRFNLYDIAWVCLLSILKKLIKISFRKTTKQYPEILIVEIPYYNKIKKVLTFCRADNASICRRRPSTWFSRGPWTSDPLSFLILMCWKISIKLKIKFCTRFVYFFNFAAKLSCISK